MITKYTGPFMLDHKDWIVFEEMAHLLVALILFILSLGGAVAEGNRNS